MGERPFQIYGDSVPKMIGRKKVMDRLRRGLNKPAPDHMKIVGPRSAGKTVLVEALVAEVRDKGDHFRGVVRWDLGLGRASDDDEFLVQLRDRVAAALELREKEWAKTLREYGEDAHDALKEVLAELAKEGIRVLVVFDGLEKTLESGRFTRNLWDNLLVLGQQKSLRYLTVSRGKPHELIRDPDSASSDFWGLFDQGQIAVECFDDEDVDAAVGCLGAVNFVPGAKTELMNWTQGSPALILSVLNELADGDARAVDSAAVNAAAERTYDRVEETLARQWNELPETAKELQRIVNREGQASLAGRPSRDGDALTERGFAVRAGDRLQKPNRFLARYLAGIEAGDASLRRLFSAEEAFLTNWRTVLELRLLQIAHPDDSLRRSIEKGLADLPNHPDNCIQNVRNIVDRALQLVWDIEIPARIVPADWLAEWKYNGERSPDNWGLAFPAKRGHRVALLHLITGTEHSRALAKHVSRSTYALVAAAQVFGDFGQHLDGNRVHPATALAAMAGCVELAATLARELRIASKGV